MPGGVNPQYRPDPSYSGPPLVPPLNQPIQKAYRDWNTSWPENSWEITENAIGYQAGYVRLLACFVTRSAAPPLAVSAPSDLTDCAGATAFLGVTASGGVPPYTYQWRQGGADVAGETADFVQLAPLDPSHAGTWDCVVTDAAPASVTSAAATVTVQLRPGAVGNTLHLNKSSADVVLTWGPVSDAGDYLASRCDASSARPCTQSGFATPVAPTATDPAPPERVVWYAVQARNACGLEP